MSNHVVFEEGQKRRVSLNRMRLENLNNEYILFKIEVYSIYVYNTVEI